MELKTLTPSQTGSTFDEGLCARAPFCTKELIFLYWQELESLPNTDVLTKITQFTPYVIRLRDFSIISLQYNWLLHHPEKDIIHGKDYHYCTVIKLQRLY